MTTKHLHRLDGLEPDNVLAFLALLGLLRALEADDRQRGEVEEAFPRVCWDLDSPPLRPCIVSRVPLSQDTLLNRAVCGIDALAVGHDFGGHKDLSHTRAESRNILAEVLASSSATMRHRIDLLAALMSDGAVRQKDKVATIDPTPLCLLFGQGHQHFLERLAEVPRQLAPPPHKKHGPALSAAACLGEALFEPWHRKDATFSFRWDPSEDVRYALMAGDPTDGAYKAGTQHGANRLAAIGLGALSMAPDVRAGRARPVVLGGRSSAEGFSLSWPIWRPPASLAAIRAMLSHPDLRNSMKMAHLGVDHVVTAQRISVGKFMNFTRARARPNVDDV